MKCVECCQPNCDKRVSGGGCLHSCSEENEVNLACTVADLQDEIAKEEAVCERAVVAAEKEAEIAVALQAKIKKLKDVITSHGYGVSREKRPINAEESICLKCGNDYNEIASLQDKLAEKEKECEERIKKMHNAQALCLERDKQVMELTEENKGYANTLDDLDEHMTEQEGVIKELRRYLIKRKTRPKVEVDVQRGILEAVLSTLDKKETL